MHKNKIGLLGSNINYSFSPYIHNYWIKQYDLSATYSTLDILEHSLNRELLLSYQQKGYIGFNITIPYKESILTLVNQYSESVQKINAANTVYLQNDCLVADNTDYYGFLLALIIAIRHNYLLKDGFNLKKLMRLYNLEESKFKLNIFKNKQNALVIGAGGAAKAVIYALLKTNIDQIYVVTRTTEKLSLLKNIFPCINVKITETKDLSQLTNIVLVVNCTPKENYNPFNFSYTSILARDSWFYDLIYNPNQTNFLAAAEAKGFNTINGLSMLIIQAAFSFERWFKVLPHIDVNLIKLLTNKLGNV